MILDSKQKLKFSCTVKHLWLDGWPWLYNRIVVGRGGGGGGACGGGVVGGCGGRAFTELLSDPWLENGLPGNRRNRVSAPDTPRAAPVTNPGRAGALATHGGLGWLEAALSSLGVGSEET